MTTTGVLAGPVGEGGRNDERDIKLVRLLLDDWQAREAGGRPLPGGPMEPRTVAAIRAFRAWIGLEPDGRIEPGGPAWEALVAYHLAGIRSGRILQEDLAFVPLPQAGDAARAGVDVREAFEVYLMLLRERP